MLFESLTITVLATLWSAWNANKQATPETANSDQQSESAAKKSEQNTNHLLDERLTERRNEYFIQLYAILISPEKSHFQQLTILCKQLACIYGISSKLDADEMSKMVLYDFNGYVKDLKESKSAIERLGKLQTLLDYSFREADKGGFLKYYFLDQGKDEAYIKSVMKNFYGYFDIILHDGFSKSKCEIRTNDLKNYNCLLGIAGEVYDNLVKVLYDYKLFDTRGRLNHELLYEMADYILANTDFYYCKGLTTERLAKDITDSIIHYIHNNVEIKRDYIAKYGNNPELYVEKLIERYLMNREIESYYYFLKMACKVLEALNYKNCLQRDSPEDERRIRIAMEKLSKLDLPILGNYEDSVIKQDIIDAFDNKDAVCKTKKRK